MTETSVCLHDPVVGTDLVVTASAATLYDVYLGRSNLGTAARDGLLTPGEGGVCARVPRWFTWSQFAPAVRSGLSHAGTG